MNNETPKQSEGTEVAGWGFQEYPDGYYSWYCGKCERYLLPGIWDDDKNPADEGLIFCPYCGSKNVETKEG